jgi:hypothetical protein
MIVKILDGLYLELDKIIVIENHNGGLRIGFMGGYTLNLHAQYKEQFVDKFDQYLLDRDSALHRPPSPETMLNITTPQQIQQEEVHPLIRAPQVSPGFFSGRPSF